MHTSIASMTGTFVYNEEGRKLFIKISNNFGILLTVPNYIELKGLNNYKYGFKTPQYTHTQIHTRKNHKYGQ